MRERYIVFVLVAVTMLVIASGGCGDETVRCKNSDSYVTESATAATEESENSHESEETMENNTEDEVEYKYKDYNEAFRDVLCMNDRFVDVENGDSSFINTYEYQSNRFYSEGINDVLTFSIVDLEWDGENEVIVYNPREERIILHYMNGRIYGYGKFFKNFAGIKQNGYYLCTYDGSLYGYEHISDFLENEEKRQFLVWENKHLFNGQIEEPSYYYCGEYDYSNPWKGELFGGEQITEEQYLKIVDDVYESSPDVEVYELTEENIELFFE